MVGRAGWADLLLSLFPLSTSDFEPGVLGNFDPFQRTPMPSQQMNMASPKIRWTKVNDSGLIPRPRHGHRAVAVRELMVVFGGGNEGIVNELHAYNTVTNQWFCPVVTGDIMPGAASFGLAAENTRLIFFGGMLEFGVYSDALYELQVGPYFATGNISTKWEWKKLKPKAPRFAQAPAPRIGHSFTYINGKFYLFGGLCREPDQNGGCQEIPIDVKYSDELYTLDFRGHSCFWEMPQTYGSAPTARESHSAVSYVDALGNPKLLIYGGMIGYRLGDLYVLDVNSMTWSKPEVDGPIPQPRSLHSGSVVGDKMYIFGGWVPLKDEMNDIPSARWKCSDTLARLNLNTYKWEDVDVDCPDGSPPPRAGHTAVVVGNRIYLWSGRDGYVRMWDLQVCCKDLWYLEVDKPSQAGKVHLVKASTRIFEVNWPETPFSEHYILQIYKYELTVVTTKSPERAKVKDTRKRTISQTDWADDDVGPMLAPTSPLPEVPPPAKVDQPLPPISICEENLPSFFLPPPKPPQPMYTMPPSKPAPRLPPMIPPPMVQPPRFMGRPMSILPPPLSQPMVQHNVVRSTAPPHFPTNAVQYIPVSEFARHFPKPDPNMRMKPPGMFVTTSFKNSQSEQTYPSTMDLVQMTPIPMKALPQRATVLKVSNPSLGTFSSMKMQPPPLPPQQVFPPHKVPPKHTIIINKPVEKLPGQQIVVVSSAPVHRPQTFHTIQTFARPEANCFPPQEKSKTTPGNGVKTFSMRLPPHTPTRVQVQNPTPAYKNVKVQVNGKTLTVMMPVSSASTTVAQNRVVYQTPQQIVLTGPCQPKPAVLQKPAVMIQPEVKQQDNSMEVEHDDAKSSEEPVIDKKQASPAVKFVDQPAAEGASKAPMLCSSVASSPSTVSCSTAPTPPCSKSGGTKQPEQPSELPDPPSNIKISKTTDGAIISWTAPIKGAVTGYSVNLGIKADEGNPNKITFINVYSDVSTKTKIPQDVLDRATLSFPKPTIIFRVSARNELGYGPATQVRWLQDPKNDSSPHSDAS